MSAPIDRGLGNITNKAMQEVAKDEAIERIAEAETASDSALESLKEAVNPLAARLREKRKIDRPARERVSKMMKGGEKAERMLPIGQIKDAANQFERRNPELKASVLTLLRQNIKPDDTKEELLKKIQDFYGDISLADEALEFLIETSEGDLARKLLEIKDEINKERGREIIAGRNISIQARMASQEGLGTPTNLRDMYRDITGNPRESTQLFDELSRKYAFKDLKKVLDFMLHSLGSDMKSKGPSIEAGQLHSLFTEVRSMQAILGVYRFFRGRMHLVTSMFQKNGLSVPQELNFEQLAKEFMGLAAERYPSSDKVMQRAVRLGIKDWILAKIIAFSQFRDAVKEVSMAQIFKTIQHRDEAYMALLEALEELEDLLEEEEEKDEQEQAEEEGDGKDGH